MMRSRSLLEPPTPITHAPPQKACMAPSGIIAALSVGFLLIGWPCPPDAIARQPSETRRQGWKQPTSPLFLSNVERFNERLISPTAKSHRQTVLRGFALENYGGAEVVRYLFGDWKQIIASHTFSRKLRGRLAKGTQEGKGFHWALRRTAQEIACKVRKEVKTDGLRAYFTAQSRGTWLAIKIKDKRATAMASYACDAFKGELMLPSPFSYARTGYNGIIHHKVVRPDQAQLVVEVDQPVPSVKFSEPQIISHVPPTRIKRVFIGFSNWYNVRTFDSPPKRIDQWFAMEVLGRDKSGRPLDLRIKPIQQSIRQNLFERWEADDTQVWQASRAATPEAKAFAARYPLLKTTLQQAQTAVRLRGLPDL